ncbi:cell division protein FtsL [Cricetibacter osteomyelitidis]|uniref:Cell division protein FtsL n=1 Tax=Cricetibacter osteomyelitidis TaxID=1521931 RepID=A0A4R2T112_9PAST|nr:cell division protein FtsL [Cricetibacter osteomyelitidis]TCP95001.1 cell division protein FtsL [Cricetibacter osteomyelitidis]
MFEKTERHPLTELILDDVFSSNKLLLTLLVSLVITMIGTIWLTHQTRQLVSDKGDLVFEKQQLEREYRNLILEETTEGNSTRIQARARKLGMGRIENDQEVLILE